MNTKWKLIYNSLLIEINSMDDKDKFYSHQQLMKKFNISKITADKILKKLKHEGFLKIIPKVGSFVEHKKSLTLNSIINLEENVSSKLSKTIFLNHEDLGPCLFYTKKRYLDNKLHSYEEIFIKRRFLPAKFTQKHVKQIQNSLLSFISENNLTTISYAKKNVQILPDDSKFIITKSTLFNTYDDIVSISTLIEPTGHLNVTYYEYKKNNFLQK